MANNWAICIGIKQYNNLQTLNCTVRDAEAMGDWFQEIGFNHVYLFTDNSPPITDTGQPYSSQPSYGNLRRFLRVRFNNPFLTAGDNLWFFFSGHGMRHNNKDYLMPSDGDPHPEGIEDTAIAVSYVSERLRRSGADNIILVLDACRNEGAKAGLGVGEEQQQGVITLASCSPSERSYEIEALNQGSFTFALLESLRIQGTGNCATVERLYQRLRYRVTEINQLYKKPKQTPYAVVEPASKYHLILLPSQATLQDVSALKLDAFEAQTEGNFTLAEQLWTRILAASPADPQALKALRQIWTKTPEILVKPQLNDNSGNKSPEISTPKPTEVALKSEKGVDYSNSEKGVDYSNLRDLLAQGKWKEADAETAKVMLQAANRVKEGWLRVEDIDRFPCEDLRTINQLWIHYSQGKFGFSVQAEIYRSFGGTRAYDKEVWEKFGDAVGWRVNSSWLSYNDITFDLSSPPRGHLPDDLCNGGDMAGGGRRVSVSLLSRPDL